MTDMKNSRHTKEQIIGFINQAGVFPILALTGPVHPQINGSSCMASICSFSVSNWPRQ
jgi:hypothetical protein